MRMPFVFATAFENTEQTIASSCGSQIHLKAAQTPCSNGDSCNDSIDNPSELNNANQYYNYPSDDLPSPGLRFLQDICRDSKNDTFIYPNVTESKANVDTPIILIDTYEEQSSHDKQPFLVPADKLTDRTVDDSQTQAADIADECGGRPAADDVTGQKEPNQNRHSRLFRLISNEGDDDTKSEMMNFASGSNFSEEIDSFMPPSFPGTRLRIRSRRAKDHIPSRAFRILQQEFDFTSSNSEDISSPCSLEQFRFTNNNHSISQTPESHSSATSDTDAFDFSIDKFHQEIN